MAQYCYICTGRGIFIIGGFYPLIGVQISTRLWHKWGVTDNRPKKRAISPLNAEKLRAIALHYVGRYATTRIKLANYLARKLRERGWDDEKPADIEGLVANFSDLGYVDDAGFAEMRARSFISKGYGSRRLSQDLTIAGIDETDRQGAMENARDAAWTAAENFARRKHIGPFARKPATPEMKRKQLQAFLRAGHGWDLAREFVGAEPDEEPDPFD